MEAACPFEAVAVAAVGGDDDDDDDIEKLADGNRVERVEAAQVWRMAFRHSPLKL